jgi:integrase
VHQADGAGDSIPHALPDSAATITWREIDFESWTWALPGERAKNRREHTIPLNKMARQILREQWVSPDGIREPNENSNVFAGAARNMSPVKRPCDAAKIAPALHTT